MQGYGRYTKGDNNFEWGVNYIYAMFTPAVVLLLAVVALQDPRRGAVSVAPAAGPALAPAPGLATQQQSAGRGWRGKYWHGYAAGEKPGAGYYG